MANEIRLTKIGAYVEYLTNGPAAPTSLAATAASQTQINLTWTDNASGETGFKIERSPDGSTGWTQIGTASANATSYNDTGLTANTTYYYTVRAYGTLGDGPYSNTANATTLPNAPTAPSGLSATAIGQSQINLAWTDNSSNETGFKIERSPDGSTDWTQIGTAAANATSYNDTGLSAATTYYYRMRAYNTGGNSSYTSTASATTTVPSVGGSLEFPSAFAAWWPRRFGQ